VWSVGLGAIAATGHCADRAGSGAESSPARQPPAATSILAGTYAEALEPVLPSQLVVTSGEVKEHGPSSVEILGATTRAVVGAEPRSMIEASFVYEGPSANDAPLASGELRRQIGLKLRARDTCNVVYVMWHIQPTSGIHVAVKTSPGQTRHEECGDRGYVSVAPSSSRRDLPPIQVGERRTISARINGQLLQVSVDGSPAWTGTLPPEAFAFDGPAGIRADNGAFVVDLRAAPSRK
jgi:hypothetical protein